MRIETHVHTRYSKDSVQCLREIFSAEIDPPQHMKNYQKSATENLAQTYQSTAKVPQH